jgi:hypothetical protein
MSRQGIIVAEEGDTISSDRIKRLDSTKKQFKYRKIYDIKFPIPALPVGTSWNKTIKVYFNEDQSSIGFIPAYEFYVQAYNSNWAIPIIASPQAYEGSDPNFPFYKSNEFVTDTYFNIRLFINNMVAGAAPTFNYPAYEATIRVIITYDNLLAL